MLVAHVNITHLEPKRLLDVRLTLFIPTPTHRHGQRVPVVQVWVPDLLGHHSAGVDQPGGDLGGLKLRAIVALRQYLVHLSLPVEVEPPAE